jgi:hypothetical protein
MRACLARAGVDDQVGPSEFPYILDDVHWARRHGYGTELAGIDQSCRTETEPDAEAATRARIDRVRADPRFTEAVRPWADCMRANGYPYASPAAARAALPLADGQETRLASTEAECALASGLAVTAKALDREYTADQA